MKGKTPKEGKPNGKTIVKTEWQTMLIVKDMKGPMHLELKQMQ
jgi:hypothetical protein